MLVHEYAPAEYMGDAEMSSLMATCCGRLVVCASKVETSIVTGLLRAGAVGVVHVHPTALVDHSVAANAVVRFIKAIQGGSSVQDAITNEPLTVVSNLS